MEGRHNALPRDCAQHEEVSLWKGTALAGARRLRRADAFSSPGLPVPRYRHVLFVKW